MSLKDISLKRCYNSDNEDILNNFYIPALRESERYDRATGYYSSSSFATAARGFSHFIKNQGNMRLLFHFAKSKQDIEDILEVTRKEKEILGDKILNDLETIRDELVENCVKVLGWMISKDLLEIRVAIPKKIFHQKIGIMTDSKGNRLSFSGSINETLSGWTGNIEEFKVFREWKPNEKYYFEDDIKKFKNFWRGDALKTNVYSLPEAVEKKLIQCKPRNKEALDETLGKIKNNYNSCFRSKKITREKEENQTERNPRAYQGEAIKNWENNGFRGIWKMATGVGKTLTAIWGAEKLFSELEKLITVIVVPFTHLMSQWEEELNIEGHKPILTSEANWKEKLEGQILDVSLGDRENIFAITTYSMYHKDKFSGLLEETEAPILLICDEVHKAGATQRKKGLKDFYNYRLGLSATPERYYDDFGTTYLKKYFKGSKDSIVYNYGLEKAIDEKYLTEYEYYPSFVKLTEQETKKYESLSKKIARRVAVIKNSDTKEFDTDEKLENLLSKRADIIKNAENKLNEAQKILEKVGNLDHTLIYCSPKQKQSVLSLLRNKLGKYHQFTEEEGLEKRKKIRDRFAGGELEVLVAMKCLDEGFDVPSAKKAIFLSSTGNPKQYIQRRGRILRPHENKDFAEIYDILVYPPGMEAGSSNQISKTAESILKKEFERYEKFMKLSRSPLKETKFKSIKRRLLY